MHRKRLFEGRAATERADRPCSRDLSPAPLRFSQFSLLIAVGTEPSLADSALCRSRGTNSRDFGSEIRSQTRSPHQMTFSGIKFRDRPTDCGITKMDGPRFRLTFSTLRWMAHVFARWMAHVFPRFPTFSSPRFPRFARFGTFSAHVLAMDHYPV